MNRTLAVHRFLLAMLLGCCLAGLAIADDSEIFSAQSAGTVGPNILLILDTSGSMSSGVYSAADYDPSASYPVTNGQNPNTGSCQTAFDETKVYIVAGQSTPTIDPISGLPVGSSVPTCPTSTTGVTSRRRPIRDVCEIPGQSRLHLLIRS